MSDRSSSPFKRSQADRRLAKDVRTGVFEEPQSLAAEVRVSYRLLEELRQHQGALETIMTGAFKVGTLLEECGGLREALEQARGDKLKDEDVWKRIRAAVERVSRAFTGLPPAFAEEFSDALHDFDEEKGPLWTAKQHLKTAMHTHDKGPSEAHSNIQAAAETMHERVSGVSEVAKDKAKESIKAISECTAKIFHEIEKAGARAEKEPSRNPPTRRPWTVRGLLRSGVSQGAFRGRQDSS